MPGRLVMETATDSIESNAARDSAQASHLSDRKAAEKSILQNGARGLVNAQSGVQDGLVTNGKLANGTTPADTGASPPLLDSTWRKTDANKPFGKLLARMAQGCYVDLQELVSKMGEEPVAEPQLNGGGPVTVEDTDIASVKKKRLLLNFASTWRERFVKALVISDWSHTSGDDVAKIIDLRATLMDRVVHIEQAVSAVGDLKRDTIASRMPALNLKGAMQYMSAGTSTYPTVGAIQQPPLTAKQILALLQEMDTTANLRLCLDEPDLPENMNEYSINNGRVTFKSHGAFQVDLACLDQNPETSPWYFIDFRFDFSPSPAQIGDQVRMHLENTINSATVATGLQGCYDFCHLFVLDQKLLEVETQAYQLMRARWSGCIAVQRLRRVVTLQYWTKRKASKRSWLEFGVVSGKSSQNTASTDPRLQVRWFRDGELVVDHSLAMDWTVISLKNFLLEVVQLHSTHILRQMKNSITQKAAGSGRLLVDLSMPHNDPYGNRLVFRFAQAHPAVGQAVTCCIGPYTGFASLSPPSTRASAYQDTVNGEIDPNRLASHIEHYLCAMGQEGVEFEAQLHRWSQVHDILPMSTKVQRNFFGIATLVTFWTPSKDWDKTSAIACATSLASQDWHAVDLKTGTTGREVTASTELDIAALSSANLLTEVVSATVVQVQYKHMSAQAHREGILFTTEIPKRAMRLTSRATAGISAYRFDVDCFMGRERKHSLARWIQGPIMISAGTLITAQNAQFVRHEIRLTATTKGLATLQRYTRSQKVDSIMFNATNGVAIRLHVRFGTSFLDGARAILYSLGRLDKTTIILQHLGMETQELSLQQVAFSYGPRQEYSARVTYSEHGSLPVSLKIFPKDINLHQRIRVSLEKLLNAERADAFSFFAHALLLTLPLLRAVTKIEESSSRIFACHVRHATWYSLKYRGSVNITFAIRARARTEGDHHTIKWHIEQERQRPGTAPSLPEALTSALKEFWTRPDVGGTMGLRTGIVSSAADIAAAVDKLHSIVVLHVKPLDLPSVAAVAPPAGAAAAAAAAAPESKATVLETKATSSEEKTQQDVIMLD